MTATLEPDVYLSVLAEESAAVADLADGHLDLAVPTCPGWTVSDLIGHLGGVYGWAAAAALGGGARPPRPAPGPSASSARLSWFRDQRQVLLDALGGLDAGAPCWSFVGPTTATWWRRRQVHESAIHRYDVHAALGDVHSIDATVATDGIDELLTVFLPGFRAYRVVAGLEGTLHFHCSDADGEWTVDLTGPEVVVRREHAAADTTLRGPASTLFLWAWNRVPLDRAGLEVLGRAEVAAAWAGLTI